MADQILKPTTVGSAVVSQLTALKSGDLGVLRKILADGMTTPNDLLRQAIFMSPPEVVGFLVESGATTGSISETSQRSGLHEAVLKGRLDVCRVLVEHGADPGYAPPATSWRPAGEDNFRLTPFQLAVFIGKLDIAAFFVSQCGQDPNCRAITGETLIQLARKHPDMKTLIRSLRTEYRILGGVESMLPEAPAAGRKQTGMSPL